MRKLGLLVMVALLALGAAPKKKVATKAAAPAPVAPAEIAHPMALFLKQMSTDGTRQVTFRATAMGTRFFFEEPSGVTVYRYLGGRYVREEFLRGYRLATAVKKYSK